MDFEIKNEMLKKHTNKTVLHPYHQDAEDMMKNHQHTHR